MADAREKKVVSKLADLHSETHFAVDIARTDLREPLGKGDLIDIPDITALTVNADGAVTANPAAVVTNVESLNANRQPWINALIPQLESIQLMDGKWADQVAETGLKNLKNDMDSDYLSYLVTNQWTTGALATNHTNVAANSLITDDILNAIATLTDLKGVTDDDLVLFMSSFGMAGLQNVSGWQPNRQSEVGKLGIPTVGEVNGIPVYKTGSTPRRRNVAIVSSAVASGTFTVTVAAGHGVVAGVQISASGMTNNPAGTVSVTSTDATTITFDSGAATDASNGAGTLIVESSENVLIAVNHNWVAQQLMPKTRIVPLSTSTGDALQISSIWGFEGRPGYCNVIHSPPSSL